MTDAIQRRVLTVCGGNTCRSPVLAFLLMAELRRIRQHNVEVQSAGASEHFAEDTGYKGPLNAFALEALRESLQAHQEVPCSDILREAKKHESQGLASLKGQKFDFIFFVNSNHERKAKHLEIVAPMTYTRK